MNKHGNYVNIGILGYGKMGRAHSNAYKKIPYIYYSRFIPHLMKICGRTGDKVATVARGYGFEEYCTHWEDIISDDRIQLFDNSGPNYMHVEPCIAAFKNGKHVICEKPLAPDPRQAKQMLEAAREAGTKHMCGFNYRFVPAIRLAKQLIQEGKLGEIYHFRARYLQDFLTDPGRPFDWRLDKEKGGGALGGLGSHIIDLSRFLVGEPESVSGSTRTFIKERPLADGSGMKSIRVDDAFAAIINFKNGALGTLEASRYAPGRKNHQIVEINGANGSLVFNLERLNELQVYLKEKGPLEGFRTILVTKPGEHPFADKWWGQGHIIGWEHTFVHALHHLLEAIVENKEIGPDGATFEDGYRCAVVCQAILDSAQSGRRINISYQQIGEQNGKS